MATISVSLPSDGTTADVADYNTPVTTIVNEINGRLDNDNIKSGAGIAGTKLASGSVGKTQLDFSSGIWWEELGRATLSSSGTTISSGTITAKKFLKVLLFVIPVTNTVQPGFRFNSDSGSNYSVRVSDNGGADVTATSQTSASFDVGGLSSEPLTGEFELVNVETKEKMAIGHSLRSGTAGGGNAVHRREIVFKWANTAAQITQVDIIRTAGTGSFDTGSMIVVLGHD